MATRVYRLYSAAITTSADNKTSLRIAKNGKVNAICASIVSSQGGDVTGYQRYELSKQSASSFSLNDAPNSVLCHFASGGPAAVSQAMAQNVLIAGLSWDVFNGDTLYLHELIAGTAPAGGNISVDLFVSE